MFAQPVPSAPLLSVVIPAHNESRTLGTVLPAVAEALGAYDCEIIVVDDGSTDGTWEQILALKERLGHIVGVRLTRNFGHQAAILAGLTAARGDAVITMDADGQHPPAVLPEFVSLWEQGHPIVQGIRVSTDGEGILKRWTSRTFYRLLSLLAGMEVPMGSADFRLLSRTVVESVLASAGPLVFLRGLIPWLGYPAVYVRFEARPRLAGNTSYTWWRMLRFSAHGLLGFTIIPLRLATLLGFAVALFSFIYLVVAVGAWLTSAAVVPGWASVMGLLSLLGGMQLLTIGVLGEYVGRMFMANLNRPHFVVRDRT
jgi:polyisoprenyl-phosphate glycosyltransferase